MRIEVPEMKACGSTPFDLFQQVITIDESIVETLSERHSMNSIHDGVGILMNLSHKFLQIGRSFQLLATKGDDNVSCNSLLRIQADYLATMFLIFGAPTKDETIFRYLLYFLDGFHKRRNSLLTNNIKPVNEELSRLKQNIDDAIENCDGGIKECEKELNNHPYKRVNEKLFKDILKNRQWKYKTFDSSLKKNEHYKWEDLYQLLDGRDSISSYYSYLSQYVHGLSNTLILEEKVDSYSLFCFEICLLARFKELLERLYGKEEIFEVINNVFTKNLETYVSFLKKTINNKNIDTE